MGIATNPSLCSPVYDQRELGRSNNDFSNAFVYLGEGGNTTRQAGSCVPVTWSEEMAPSWALPETASCVLGLKHYGIYLAQGNMTAV